MAKLDDMSGNLAKTHIFTLLHCTNLISHLGRSQFFFLIVYLVYFKVFFRILSQYIYTRKKKILTNGEKIDVIKKIDGGIRPAEIAAEFCVAKVRL